MAFGIDTSRLKEIVAHHADALENAERVIATAMVRDTSITPDEMMATLKWISAVRFAVLVQSDEGRDPNHADFAALIDAVCEAAA
jgi:hypothetical protein